MAKPGPTSQQHALGVAGSLLKIARTQRGWSQRQLAEAAGVPTSTIGKIESGRRQPTLPTLYRLLAAADLDLRVRLEAYDDHDDVLDARRDRMTDAERAVEDQRFAANDALLSAARARGPLPV